jgi:hypothetical protein
MRPTRSASAGAPSAAMPKRSDNPEGVEPTRTPQARRRFLPIAYLAELEGSYRTPIAGLAGLGAGWPG